MLFTMRDVEMLRCALHCFDFAADAADRVDAAYQLRAIERPFLSPLSFLMPDFIRSLICYAIYAVYGTCRSDAAYADAAAATPLSLPPCSLWPCLLLMARAAARDACLRHGRHGCYSLRATPPADAFVMLITLSPYVHY